MKRCYWAEGGDATYIAYHDTEWGVPVHDDQKLFEFIILEGAQAGLSWKTILARRDGYRKAFKNFDPKKIARMNEVDVERLMQDSGIIRNRLKIKSAITNAKLFVDIAEEYGSFSSYIWNFVGNKPIFNNWKTHSEIPPVTELAIAISKDLKKRGFRFFGPTICYAHMQATGMVNDHTQDCFRYKQLL